MCGFGDFVGLVWFSVYVLGCFLFVFLFWKFSATASREGELVQRNI